MEVIKQLVQAKFLLFNVGTNKAPVDRSGKGMGGWINKSYDELVKEHNYNSMLWGMNMGLQPNGRRILSLDFDVYDKNEMDGYNNCKITLGKLNEYLEGCVNKNGMYESSTKGNMNVLVDYTSHQGIINMVERLGSNKFQHSGLEILLGGNQVIPPSQTMCKRTGTLGNPRNPLTNNMFYIITDDTDFTATFITNLFNIKFQENQPKKQPTKITMVQPDPEPEDETGTDEDDEEDEYKDKYMELLFNVIKNEIKNKKKVIDWDTWFQIGGILKYNGYAKEIFQKYTNSTPGKVPTNSWLKLWNDIRNPNKTMSIYGLQNIARRLNPYGYKEWLDKHNEYLHLGILDMGENDVGKFIGKFLETDLVYCRKEWIHFNTKTCLWDIIEEPTAVIITAVQSKISEAKSIAEHKIGESADDEEKEVLKKKIKCYTEHYRNVCKSAYSSQLVKYLKTYLRNNDFTNGLDNGLYKLFFQNGFLDLKTSNFVKGIKRSDYITKTIPFDWEEPTAVDVGLVRNIIKKICNWNEQHLEYYLSMLGYCFTGDCSKEQNFWYLRGQTASNGKSIIFEILEKIMPNYVLKANSDVLDKNADLRKEVATWRGLKCLWLNEVSTKAKDAERVKCICDGTGYKYNRLYATEAVVMPITFKLIAVSNNSYEGDGDKGIVRRFKILQHNAQFKEAYTKDNYEKLEFICDKELNTKLSGDLKFALIALITTYSRAYWIEKKLKPYPDDWAKEAKENMADNDKFGEWFNDTFETGVGYTLYKDDFTSMFSSSPVKSLKAKDEVARLSNGCRYESQMKKNITTSTGVSVQKKGFWVGFRLKTAEEKAGNGEEMEEEKETD
jgi:hypothetical protein